jgi:hypothetical protein
MLGFPAPLDASHLLWAGESHTLNFPCEGTNFDGAGIFL